MARDRYHGKLNMFRTNVNEEEQAAYETFQNVRKIEVEIEKSEIIALINAIPKIENFDSPEYNAAASLLDLTQKLRKAWEKETFKIFI